MNTKTATVRMPAQMYDRLAELAADEHRSVNGQILALLEDAMSEKMAA